jgi:Transcriptional Coactivator p15 (PC4)
MSSQAPPAETGQRLATLARGRDEELRVNFSTYEGSPYLSLRMWTRDRRTGHWWPDSKRGCSVRIRELRMLAKAVAEAITISDEIRAGWIPIPSEPGARGKPRRPRAPGPADDQVEPEPFDEF